MRIALLSLLLATPLVASPPPPPNLDARVTKEIDRLEATLRGIDVASSKDMAQMAEGDRGLLARVRGSVSPLVRVYRLRDAFIGVETLRFLSEHWAATADMEKVRVLANERRDAFEKPLAPMRAPLLQLALRQGAANRAGKLYRASVPYGKVSSAFSGLYYLAEAEGNRRYREFVEALPFGGAEEARPNQAAMRAALTTLDTAALAEFERDPVGRSAIPLSALLKEAREELDRGSLEGAVLTMLEAQIAISRRQKTASNAPVAAFSARTDSLGVLWQALSRENDAETSRMIDRDVLPLYASLYRSVPGVKAAPKSVTVTLVRWPYT